MNNFGEVTVSFSPFAPKGKYVFDKRGFGVVFHDRYDLMTAIFWERMGRVLYRLTAEATDAWEDVRGYE